jgi:hypothetical protein
MSIVGHVIAQAIDLVESWIPYISLGIWFNVSSYYSTKPEQSFVNWKWCKRPVCGGCAKEFNTSSASTDINSGNFQALQNPCSAPVVQEARCDGCAKELSIAHNATTTRIHFCHAWALQNLGSAPE